MCIAKCDKPFLGHNEIISNIQKGLFKEFIKLSAKYDSVLKKIIDYEIQNYSRLH